MQNYIWSKQLPSKLWISLQLWNFASNSIANTVELPLVTSDLITQSQYSSYYYSSQDGSGGILESGEWISYELPKSIVLWGIIIVADNENLDSAPCDFKVYGP